MWGAGGTAITLGCGDPSPAEPFTCAGGWVAAGLVRGQALTAGAAAALAANDAREGYEQLTCKP